MGTGDWDPATASFLLDEGAAELMAGDDRLAGHSLRGERGQAAEQEADVAIDHRLASSSEPARRVPCRGRIQWDARRQPVGGEGTLIEAADPGVPTRTLRELKRAAAAEAIDEAAELLIAARRAIDATGKPRLRQLVDVLLLEVAREIASHSETAGPPSH